MADIELIGMQELIDTVSKLGEKGTRIKEKALSEAGEVVGKSMAEKAPRSDMAKEHMADHIHVSDVQGNDGVDFVTIGPGKGDNSQFFYAKFTEWGTTKIPAQHWAEQSILENNRKIKNIIKEELLRGLEDIDK